MHPSIMQAVVTVPVQTEALVGVVYCKDRVLEPWLRFEKREKKRIVKQALTPKEKRIGQSKKKAKLKYKMPTRCQAQS